ncbi:hypothetical protein ACNDVF_004976 [Escherichia coli]|nr:hypothetical protein [Klebsiella pneumoniae]
MDFLIFTVIVFPSIFLIAIVFQNLRKRGYGPQLDAVAKKLESFKERYAPDVIRFTNNTSRVFNKKSPLGEQSNEETINKLNGEVKKLTEAIERLNK